MSDQESHIITPSAMGTWIAGGFILAMLAFVLAMFAIYRSNAITAGTQLEILSLVKKVDNLQKQVGPAPSQAPQGAK